MGVTGAGVGGFAELAFLLGVDDGVFESRPKNKNVTQNYITSLIILPEVFLSFSSLLRFSAGILFNNACSCLVTSF